MSRDARIYLMFDIRFLELVYSDILLQIIFYYKVDQKREYEIEMIVDKNYQKKYLVKWKKYPDFENTWELLLNL